MADATGSAGDGYDTVLSYDASIGATTEQPFALSLVSVAGGAEGPCAGWDPYIGTPLARRARPCPASSDFSADKFTLDTSGSPPRTTCRRHVLGGEGGNAKFATIDVVFTPCADFSKDPMVGDGGDAFVKATKQTVALGDGRRAAGRLGVQGRRRRPGLGDRRPGRHRPGDERETDYSYDWTIDQGPSAGWHVTVQLWSDNTESADQTAPRTARRSTSSRQLHHHGHGRASNGDITPGTGSVTTVRGPDVHHHARRRATTSTT